MNSKFFGETTFTIYSGCVQHIGGEQDCLGYKCEFCHTYYGESNDVHIDGKKNNYESISSNGFCDRCNIFVGKEIKAGETYAANWNGVEYIKFVPTVSDNYVVTVETQESVNKYDGFSLYLYDEKLNYIYEYNAMGSTLIETINFEEGKVYYLYAYNFNGYAIDITVECETHKGTVQTCYGYVCDACGGYFGEALGHDIITDEYKAPTCTETGLEEGQHCSRCDDMTVAQEVIPAIGEHIDTDGDTMCDHGGEQLTCGDCLRPVHGDTLIDNFVCWIVMLINLIKTMF